MLKRLARFDIRHWVGLAGESFEREMEVRRLHFFAWFLAVFSVSGLGPLARKTDC